MPPTVQQTRERKKISPLVPFEKLKNSKAWKLTSELVRKQSKGICYTCEKRYPFEKLVAGHFREKRGNAATYFDLDGLRAQCGWNCNRMGHGMKDIYAMKLERENPGIVEELFKRSRETKKWTKQELIEIAEERKMQLECVGCLN